MKRITKTQSQLRAENKKLAAIIVKMRSETLRQMRQSVLVKLADQAQKCLNSGI